MTAEVCTVGSLFSGIGGLDLGLERAGMSVRWQSEIDKYCRKVLAARWPTVPNLGDVRNVDFTEVENVELICGGYPCQPFSLAGQRGGLSDPRFLWQHFERALRDIRPRFAILENVPGHLTLGFSGILADLADLGYSAEWELLPAAAFGAPHLRYRLFTVAYAGSAGYEPLRREIPANAAETLSESEPGLHKLATGSGPSVRRGIMGRVGEILETLQLPGFEDGRGTTASGIIENVADADRLGRQRRTPRTGFEPDAAERDEKVDFSANGSREFPDADRLGREFEREPQPAGIESSSRNVTNRRGRSRPISSEVGPDAERQGRETRNAVEGISGKASGDGLEPDNGVRGLRFPNRAAWWDVEPELGRVAYGVPHRVDRLRTLGNAVVPQIAEFIGRAILEVRNGRPLDL